MLLVHNIKVGGTILRGYVDELLPILLEFLGDASSSQKREVSLWTLSQLVESTGCVVEPYNKHPQVNTLSFHKHRGIKLIVCSYWLIC